MATKIHLNKDDEITIKKKSGESRSFKMAASGAVTIESGKGDKVAAKKGKGKSGGITGGKVVFGLLVLFLLYAFCGQQPQQRSRINTQSYGYNNK
jgi:hypothetical protein